MIVFQLSLQPSPSRRFLTSLESRCGFSFSSKHTQLTAPPPFGSPPHFRKFTCVHSERNRTRVHLRENTEPRVVIKITSSPVFVQIFTPVELRGPSAETKEPTRLDYDQTRTRPPSDQDQSWIRPELLHRCGCGLRKGFGTLLLTIWT